MSRSFIDTNIFAYFFDVHDSKRRNLARSAAGDLLNSGEAVVSYQVIQEFANVALRKFRAVLTVSQVQAFLDEILWPVCAVIPDAALCSQALSIASETGYGFYDSLIVAAAVRSECGILLTEDLQSGRKIRGVEIRNPFA